MQLTALYLAFQHHILIYVFAYARIAVVFYMLPALGGRILSNLIVKNTVVSLVIIGLWPCFSETITLQEGWFFILVKEVLAGLILAMSLCLPFWVAIFVGELFDNQRGATLSDSIDPINGVQASVMSSFISFAFGAIFFANNGMRLLLDVLSESYSVFPPGKDFAAATWSGAGHLLMTLSKESIILAAPVLIIMMVSEVLLGVFSRYCPQLNAFSISLTIKSSIAFFVFLLYGIQSLSDKTFHLFSIVHFLKFVN